MNESKTGKKFHSIPTYVDDAGFIQEHGQHLRKVEQL